MNSAPRGRIRNTRSKLLLPAAAFLLLATTGCQFFEPARIQVKDSGAANVGQRLGKQRLLSTPYLPSTALSGLSDRAGVNIHHIGGKNMERAREAGFGWVRIDFLWSGLEPVQGQIEWGVILGTFKELQSKGLKPMTTVAYSPRWAIADEEACITHCRQKYAEVGADASVCDTRDFSKVLSRCMPHVSAWENFLEQVARESKVYGGEYFGLWNEPHTTFFLSKDTDYDQLMIRGCQALKRGNPNAKCIGPDGGMDDTAKDRYGKPEWTIARLEAARAAGVHIDVIDVHDYSPAPEFLRRLKNFKTLLTQKGFQQPVWVTETSAFHLEPNFHWAGQAYERMERDSVAKLKLLSENPSVIDRIFFYELNDTSTIGVQPYTKHPEEEDFGLTSGGFNECRRRPGFNAIKSLFQGTYSACPAGQCTGTDGQCCAGACVYRSDGLNDEFSCSSPLPEQIKCNLDALKAGMDSDEGIVEYTYCMMLDREADAIGKNIWTGYVKDPAKTEARLDLLKVFFNSAEFATRFPPGALTDVQFVEMLYRKLLLRAADDVGKKIKVDQLAAGKTREALFLEMIRSDEFFGKHPAYKPETPIETAGISRSCELKAPDLSNLSAVGYIYCLMFARSADDSGRDFWTNAMNQGHVKRIELVQRFFESEEFARRFDPAAMDHRQFVQFLYRLLYSREGDEGGVAHWSAQIQNGATRRAVFDQFVMSAEFKANHPVISGN